MSMEMYESRWAEWKCRRAGWDEYGSVGEQVG
jgi:hypothetical protein